MTTFGKRDSAPAAPGAKPTFGKKSAQAPSGNPAPQPQRLSPQAMAFLDAERSRPPVAPPVAANENPAPRAAAAPMPQPRPPAPSQPAPSQPAPSQPAPKPAEPLAAAPTRAPSEARRPSSRHAYAGKPVWGRRIAARLVDELGVWILIFAVFYEGLTTALSAYAGADPGSTYETAAMVDLLGYAFVFMIAQCAYNIAMESSSRQATLGKLLVGAVVTARDGKKPTLGSIVLRNTVGRFAANAIPFYAGYFVGLFNPERRCVHDMIGGTVVRRRGSASSSANHSDVFA